MYTELECGICYLSYNAGRRCPRELHCKHTFCESCLLALSRSLASTDDPDRSIVCPMCRHTTALSAEERIRAELRVDECAMEQLLVTGAFLEPEEEEDPEENPEEGSLDSVEERTSSESSAEDSDLSDSHNRGRLRRAVRKVWKKISGKSSQQNGSHSTDMSSEDMRNFAMMACYMF